MRGVQTCLMSGFNLHSLRNVSLLFSLVLCACVPEKEKRFEPLKGGELTEQSPKLDDRKVRVLLHYEYDEEHSWRGCIPSGFIRTVNPETKKHVEAGFFQSSLVYLYLAYDNNQLLSPLSVLGQEVDSSLGASIVATDFDWESRSRFSNDSAFNSSVLKKRRNEFVYGLEKTGLDFDWGEGDVDYIAEDIDLGYVHVRCVPRLGQDPSQLDPSKAGICTASFKLHEDVLLRVNMPHAYLPEWRKISLLVSDQVYSWGASEC